MTKRRIPLLIVLAIGVGIVAAGSQARPQLDVRPPDHLATATFAMG
ncbi:MAG: hypothetical protein AB1758_24980 [Candidatus Eremiobacterota bacterium]